MGLMSYSEQQKAISTLKTKYRGCPNCGSSGGGIGDIVGVPILERGIPSGVAAGNQLLAMLPLTCPDCGYVTFFAAKEFVELD